MAGGDSSGGGEVEEGREGREAADLGFASRAACGRGNAGGPVFIKRALLAGSTGTNRSTQNLNPCFISR
jgi:hypothetical protein